MDGQEIQGFVAANLRQNRFDFYDSNSQRLDIKQNIKQQEQKQDQGVDLNAQKQGDAKLVQMPVTEKQKEGTEKGQKIGGQKETEKANQGRRQKMKVS